MLHGILAESIWVSASIKLRTRVIETAYSRNQFTRTRAIQSDDTSFLGLITMNPPHTRGSHPRSFQVNFIQKGPRRHATLQRLRRKAGSERSSIPRDHDPGMRQESFLTRVMLLAAVDCRSRQSGNATGSSGNRASWVLFNPILVARLRRSRGEIPTKAKFFRPAV